MKRLLILVVAGLAVLSPSALASSIVTVGSPPGTTPQNHQNEPASPLARIPTPAGVRVEAGGLPLNVSRRYRRGRRATQRFAAMGQYGDVGGCPREQGFAPQGGSPARLHLPASRRSHPSSHRPSYVQQTATTVRPG